MKKYAIQFQMVYEMIRSWYCKSCDIKTTLIDDMANIACTNCGEKMNAISECKHFSIVQN